MFAVLSSFLASQVIAPIVPGIKRNRYEYRREADCSRKASEIANAIPERLSLHNEGWHAWHEISTSSRVSPWRKYSPTSNGRLPALNRYKLRTPRPSIPRAV